MTNLIDSRQRNNQDGFGLAVVEESTINNDDFDNSRKTNTKGFFDTIQRIRSSLITEIRKRLHNFPMLSRFAVWWISLIPPRFFVLFLMWKVFMLTLFVSTAVHLLYIQMKGGVRGKITYHSYAQHQSLLQHMQAQHHMMEEAKILKIDEEAPSLRILHIVTAISEYNNGRRGTVRGEDRLQQVLIPILGESVKSMTEQNFHVDVYLILGFTLTDEREQLVRDNLPPNVGLEVWNNAVPIGYDRNDFKAIQLVTRSLSRQHRYVIKDKLFHYDFFSAWEDDMYITSHHIQHYLEVSKELDKLKEEALLLPSKLSPFAISGNLSYKQLEKVFPGFIRVEVLKPNSQSQKFIDPIPVDLNFSNDANSIPQHKNINPQYCCGMSETNMILNKRLPAHPTHDQVVTWESRIHGYSVREFPRSSSLGWVALQPGPNPSDYEARISGYWSGTGGMLGERPTPGHPRYFGQQGGFMATRAQILEFERLCTKEFLPPFNSFADDGLDRMNVEFWSGGQQLWGNGAKLGCNLQRILILDPERFSKQLLYHTANNKQNTIQNRRIVRVNDLIGQLNNVKKAAMAAILKS